MPRSSRCCGNGLCAGCGIGEDIHSAKYKDYSVYVPSPPSRLPAVNDPRSLGISVRSGMPNMYHTGASAEQLAGGKITSPVLRAMFGGQQAKDWKKAKKIIAPVIQAVAPIVAPEVSPFVKTALGGKGMSGFGVAVIGGQRGVRR